MKRSIEGEEVLTSALFPSVEVLCSEDDPIRAIEAFVKESSVQGAGWSDPVDDPDRVNAIRSWYRYNSMRRCDSGGYQSVARSLLMRSPTSASTVTSSHLWRERPAKRLVSQVDGPCRSRLFEERRDPRCERMALRLCARASNL